MPTKPVWYVTKMKKAQLRELDMFMAPFKSLGSKTKSKSKTKSYKAPQLPKHLRKKKVKQHE